MSKAIRHPRRILVLCLILLASAVALAALLWPHQPEASAPGEALLAAAEPLDDISITASFEPEERQLQVSQTLRLTNRTGLRQQALVLRTYANAYRDEEYSPAATEELHSACYPNGFSAGGLTFQAVKQLSASGEIGLSYTYEDDAHTVLRLSLPEEWPAGGELSLRLDYTLTIPRAAHRFGESNGLWTLGNVFVTPSPFVDGEYLTDPYSSIGDPFVSECRNYTVSLTVPKGFQAAGSAEAQIHAWESAPMDKTVYHFEALAVRDFALTLSQGYHQASALQDGVLLRVYAASDERAERVLRYAGKALSCFNARYGAYPYPCLTFAEVGFPFGGMEYPGLIMLGSAYLGEDGDTLELLVAHETAHQWWYAVVGSDQYRQAWQDEALCEFAVLDYWETAHGRAAREDLQFSRVETSMRITIPQGVTPGSPVDYFGDLGEYSTVVYGRGAAALCALDTAMEGGLDGFLAEYYHTYAFQLASRQDFEALLRSYSGEDWSPLLTDYLDTYID